MEIHVYILSMDRKGFQLWSVKNGQAVPLPSDSQKGYAEQEKNRKSISDNVELWHKEANKKNYFIPMTTQVFLSQQAERSVHCAAQVYTFRSEKKLKIFSPASFAYHQGITAYTK